MTKKKPAMGTSTKTPSKPRNQAEAAPLSPSAAQLQMAAYEQAVNFFSKGQLPESVARFREAAKGPAPHISDKARTYVQICERRTANFDLQLHTAEDHFN